MATQYNISTDISALIVEYYQEKALDESQYENDLLMRGQKGELPLGNSTVYHWHRWTKFGLASDLTEGSQGDPATGESMDATDVKCGLKEFGDFVRIPLFGDSVRLDSAADQAYIKFNEQAKRTANRRAMTKIVQGSNGVTGDSFSAFTKMYAAGKTGFADLVAGGTCQITNKDVSRAVAYLEQNQAPGPIYATLDPWTKADLMIDDGDFRDLIKYSDLNILKRNNLPQWANASLDRQDEPWRENLSSSGGAEGTYAAAGGIIGMFIYSPNAFGTVQLMGKGGLKPKFHVQNISVTGAEMTIGYRIPFATAVLNANWGIQLRGVSRDASVASVA